MQNSAALRVLVVDDEALIRWSVSQTLVERGYEVVETADASGTRLLVGDTQPFDVVLLDYRLPDSDDLSLLASIRKASPTTQVILMTAFGSPEVVRGALDLGAYQVINKPFDMHAIADLVAKAHTAGSNGETSASSDTPWNARCFSPRATLTADEFPVASGTGSRLTEAAAPVALDDRLLELESNLILWALKVSNGNKSKAAELLQIKRSTLGDRINRCGLRHEAAPATECGGAHANAV